MTNQSLPSRVLVALKYIQENLHAELTLELVAQQAFISKYHFHRIFKVYTDETLSAHIRRLRLEKAAGMLIDGNKKIVDIAFQCGFEHHETFSRAFAKSFGHSPKDFRHQQARLPASNDIHFDFSPSSLPLSTKGENNVEVKLENFTALNVTVHYVMGNQETIPQKWQELIKFVKNCGALNDKCRFLTISYDDPRITDSSKQRFELCVSTDQTLESSEYMAKTIPSMKVAKVIHKGDLALIEDSFMAFYAGWLPQSNFEPAEAPPFVEYLNSPFNTPVEDLRTALYIPVQG